MAEPIPIPTNPRFQDRTGLRCNRWTFIRYAGNGLWLVRCDCGTERKTKGNRVTNGHSKSCGCLRTEVATSHVHLATRAKTKHRALRTPEYGSWRAMNSRCSTVRVPLRHNYSGRGITICRRWLGKDGFTNFLADMGPRPQGCSLERIDNDGNYEPNNCRWATNLEQANNRQCTHLLTVRGAARSIAEWARVTGLKRNTIMSRLRDGWSDEEIILTPLLPKGRSRRKRMNA